MTSRYYQMNSDLSLPPDSFISQRHNGVAPQIQIAVFAADGLPVVRYLGERMAIFSFIAETA